MLGPNGSARGMHNKAMIKGCDISHWQGSINWKKIPKEIDFVIMKASEGTTIKDVKFEEYKAGARGRGFGVGFYHFASGTDPVKEADFFLKCVGDIAEGEILALDFEGAAVKIKDPVGFCEKFLQRIYDKVGFWPVFYSYSSFVTGITSKLILGCGLWIADPSDAPRIGNWPFYAIWQYTVGPVNSMPGIPAKIDLDYFNGDIATFRKYGAPKEKEVIDYQELFQEEKTKREALETQVAQITAEKQALVDKIERIKKAVFDILG